MSSLNGDSMDDFKSLHLDDDDDDGYKQTTEEPINKDKYDDDDDADDDDDKKDCEPVTLGFVKRPKYWWSTLRHMLPSLAGGVPAWLDPINLPSGKSILCDLCEEPMHFVLQLYNFIKNNESACHRTLFLFMCPSMSCLLRDQHEQKRSPEKAMRSVKVFRCQLPRFNPFYSSVAEDDGTAKLLGHGAPLCTWCGTWKGDKVCGACRKARYCSPKHQALHWHMGHKTECQELCVAMESSDAALVDNGVALTQKQKVASKSLWKQYVLDSVAESEYDTEMSEDDEIAKRLVSKREGDDDQMKQLMNDYEGDADKKTFVNFQQRIAKAPAQVLRCSQSYVAKPLWPIANGRLSKSKIPNCKYCGGPLCFEFQVMPQLLYFFDVKNDKDSLDWATIVVYTCENSCDSSLSYKEEFVWVQQYTQTT